MSRPLLWQWDGEAMRPASPGMAKEADAIFVIGERYRLGIVEERSQASHNHFFAEIQSLHDTLPDHWRGLLPSPEHLRKYALIRAGYCDTTTFPCASKAEAERWAANLRPIDSFSLVEVRGSVVVLHRAHSQSKKEMGPKVFQESKDAVFDQIAIILGTADRRAA